MGAIRAVLLDLDETLIRDVASTQAALLATAADVCGARGWDAPTLGRAVLEEARSLWQAGPLHEYCLRIGISSGEGLWATFAVGDDLDTAGLRGWAPLYRREAWRRGLRTACRTEDRDLCAELAEGYVAERARRQTLFEETLPVLTALRVAGMRLAMVTNGDRDLQRRKAAGSGLIPLFDQVVISGELGVGKPAPEIFEYAMGLIGARPDETVMVGDSLLRDIAGGAGAGIRTVWLDRFGKGAAVADGRAWAVLPDLGGLPALLQGA